MWAQLGKESHLPQTTPARLLPGEGEVCRLVAVVFCLFVLNLRNFVSGWVPGFFVTWPAGGRAENCYQHLGTSRSKPSQTRPVPWGWRGGLPIWCDSGSCQWGKVAWGGSGTVGAPLHTYTHTQDPTKI